MKTLGIIGATALFLVLASNVPVFAQQEHQKEESKPAQHEQQAKPAQREQPSKPAAQARQDQPAKQEAQPKSARQETAAKPAQQQQSARTAGQETQAKPEQRQGQAKSTSSEARNTPATQEGRNSGSQQHVQRTSAEESKQRAVPALRLSGRGSARIPDERFHSNFGREHEFRIGSPRLVGGFSRFQYSGYWFGFVQPWPVEWYYTDDVYVDFIDGEYFLLNPYYPGARIEISIVG